MKNASLRPLLLSLCLLSPGLAHARGDGGGLLAWAAVFVFGVVLVWFWKWATLIALTVGFLAAGIWVMVTTTTTLGFIGGAATALIGGALTLAGLSGFRGR